VHTVAQLDLDIFAIACNSHIGLAQLTQQIKRRASFLPESQSQRILLAPLSHSFPDVAGHSVEPVSGTRAINSLVRALMIIVADPVTYTLLRVGKRGEYRLL
jgi:hypothetical protein